MLTCKKLVLPQELTSMAEAVASWPWLWPPAVPVFFLLWISCSSSLCPLAKQSFENSHLSGSTFLKPCSTQLGQQSETLP